MAERPTVFVDMDGVVADFDSELERRLLLVDPTIDISDKSSNFYLDKRMKTAAAAALARSLANEQGFFLSLPPIEGAVEAWQKMEDDGFHPRILSKPLKTNPWCESEKLEWLDAIYGPKVASEAILSDDKAGFDGITLIDDRETIPDAESAKWQHVLFSKPSNLEVATDFRLDGWTDPSLNTLLARCALRYSSLFGQPLL